MAVKSINQIIALFQTIRQGHKQIKSFGFGEEWQINGASEADRNYPKLWVIPVDSIQKEQTIERTFDILVFDLVDHKEENNINEVRSDTERILSDVIKILKYESSDYNVLNEPQMFPFTERYADDVTGYRAQATIETDFNSNYCDIPSDDLVLPSPVADFLVTIKDQDGNVLRSFTMSGSYAVEVLQEILDTIDSNTTTIIDPIT